LALLAGLAIAWLVAMIVYHFIPAGIGLRVVHIDIEVPNNLAFLVTVAFLVARFRRISLAWSNVAFGVIAFVALTVGSVWLGAIHFGEWGRGALLLMGAAGAIGSYPAGPDVPLDGGMQFWGASVLGLTVLGILIGALLRPWIASPRSQ
jgi:hypothetical protein